MILADNDRRIAARPCKKLLPLPAEGLHRHLHGDEGPAGHDSPARSAAARIPAARRQDAKPKWPRNWASRRPIVKQRVAQLHEMNPMLGHRGCRLAVTYPEILEMQVTAIIEAAIACKQKKIDAQAEIMIPLVGTAAELADAARADASDDRRRSRRRRSSTASSTSSIGTMIEIPRAASDRRRDRRACRLLQLRHERPDADDVRLQPRRHQHVPARLPEAGTAAARPVPIARRRRASASWSRWASRRAARRRRA